MPMQIIIRSQFSRRRPPLGLDQSSFSLRTLLSRDDDGDDLSIWIKNRSKKEATAIPPNVYLML